MNTFGKVSEQLMVERLNPESISTLNCRLACSTHVVKPLKITYPTVWFYMSVAFSAFSYACIAAGSVSRSLVGLYPGRLQNDSSWHFVCLFFVRQQWIVWRTQGGYYALPTYLIVVDNVQNALPKHCWRLGTVLHAVVQMNFCTLA